MMSRWATSGNVRLPTRSPIGRPMTSTRSGSIRVIEVIHPRLLDDLSAANRMLPPDPPLGHVASGGFIALNGNHRGSIFGIQDRTRPIAHPRTCRAISCSGRGFRRATCGGFPSPPLRTEGLGASRPSPVVGDEGLCCRNMEPKKTETEQGSHHLTVHRPFSILPAA